MRFPNRRRGPRCGPYVAAIATFAMSAICLGEEWPKWLGPNGNGISTEAIADQWPAGGPRKVWERPVGYGYSSPIGFEGRVYLLAMQGRNDVLTAFDAESGNQIWSQQYEVKIPADQPQAKDENTGLPLPEATPAIDNGKIYTYGGGGDLYCRNLTDGSEAWHLNVLRETKARILPWNQSSSPLVTERMVYVQGGSNGPIAVAVDKQSGKIAWKSQKTGFAGYSAPIIADVQQRKQLIIFANDSVNGLDPESGATIWSFPWTPRVKVSAATPVYHDNHLFVSCDYMYGCMMLTLSADGAKEDWPRPQPQVMCKFQPPIFDDGVIYVNSGGTIKCFSWPDVQMKWEARETNLRLGEGGSIVRDGDKLITMSERGRLSLLRATPQGYSPISQMQLFDFTKVWSMPLIYHGKLYAMGEDNLVCLDISPK